MRLREARLARGVKQADVARRAGISPSYLALIEKGRRPIGGALLGRLADALDMDRARLSAEEDTAQIDALAGLAAAEGMPETGQRQAAELIRRFPDWAALIDRMAQQRERDQDRIGALADRLTHDPALADAMHELLTTVASIRSTAAILAQTPELERIWLDRFHSNLDTESRRLAAGAEAVVSYFDDQVEAEGNLTPAEAAAAFLEQAEAGLALDDRARDEALANLSMPVAQIVRAALDRDAEDATALPDPDPDTPPPVLAARYRRPLAQVLRRLAALDPARGMVVADASGALVRRRPIAGFALPVIGAGCPLWPLYAAFSRPLSPIEELVETPDGALWHVCAVAETVAQTERGPVFESTMLVTRASSGTAPLKVGPGCRICPRGNCPARREPSLLSGAET